MISDRPAGRATPREWAGLAVLALPCLLYSMDLTVLNLAVPHLTADLAPSPSQLLWIVDVYGFLLAGFLITMGTLGDRIGRRRLLLTGAAAFGAGSAVAAFAPSAEALIAARALLGVAAATLAPSTLSLIRNMFHDPSERAVAVGVWVASFSAGGALGPLVGGVLLAHFWWGSVFLAAVPVMMLLLALGPFLLPEFRDPEAGRLDLLSVALSLVSVLAVIYGVKRLAEHGAAWPPALAIAAGLAVGVLFLRRQRTLADPLIDLGLLRTPSIGAALAVNVLCLFAAFGVFLMFSQYLQLVLGMGPLEAGLWTAPSGVMFVVGSLTTPLLGRRFRPAHVMAAGMALAALGLAALTRVGAADCAPWVLFAGFLVFCLGIAPVGTLTTDMVVGTAPPERAGSASGISETSFELGAALGVAVLGSIVTAVYRGLMDAAAAGGVEGISAEPLLAAARETLGGAVAMAGRLPGGEGDRLLAVARTAFEGSLEVAAAVCAALAAATAVLALLTLRGVPPGTAPAA
jgi:DHA2 family multidrug resistance protein-like MFS transporter